MSVLLGADNYFSSNMEPLTEWEGAKGAVLMVDILEREKVVILCRYVACVDVKTLRHYAKLHLCNDFQG